MPRIAWAVGLSVSSTLAGCLAGCTAEPTQRHRSVFELPSGSIAFNLTLSSGAQLSEVVATISGAPLSDILVRTIPVGESSSVSAVFGGLDVGDYVISLEGESDDGSTTCQGSSEFSIEAGQRATVVVGLNCRKEQTGGGVIIDTTENVCPELTFLFAAPVQALVGSEIAFEADAADADGDPLSFLWSATEGSFTSPTATSTAYSCDILGDHLVSLTFDDGQGCARTENIEISCFPGPECADGLLSPGEECDPPNGVTCDENCASIEVVCGNGIVQPGEDCDPPDGEACGDDCRTVGAANCPDLLFVQVTPSEPETQFDVSALAPGVEPPAEPLVYEWSAESGSFEDASLSSTKFSCSAGEPTLLRVSASHVEGCSVSASVSVPCTLQ